METDNLQQKSRCMLLELPPELRLLIYEHLLSSSGYGAQTWEAKFDREKDEIRMNTDAENITLLLATRDRIPKLDSMPRTCKQVRSEVKSLINAKIKNKLFIVQVCCRRPPQPRPNPRPGRKWLTLPFEPCGIFDRIRNLRLELWRFRYVDDGPEYGDILLPLGKFLQRIDFGSELRSLRIEANTKANDPDLWPREGVERLLEMLNRLRCAFTIHLDDKTLLEQVRQAWGSRVRRVVEELADAQVTKVRCRALKE